MRWKLVVGIVGLVSVLGFTVGAVAQDDASTATAATAADTGSSSDAGLARAGGTIGSCIWKSAPNGGGRVKLQVPYFCKNGLCRINLVWDGDTSFGAFGPGMLFGIDYMQFDSGRWIAGPAIAIAGVSFPEGRGRNGDQISQTLMATQASDGTVISLVDDEPGFENGRKRWVLELAHGDPSDRSVTSLSVLVCPYG